jgi:hypothetical protein
VRDFNIDYQTGKPIFASNEAVGRELVHIANTTAYLPPAHRGGPNPAHPPSDPRTVLFWIDRLIASGYNPHNERHKALFAFGDKLRAELEPKGDA